MPAHVQASYYNARSLSPPHCILILEDEEIVNLILSKSRDHAKFQHYSKIFQFRYKLMSSRIPINNDDPEMSGSKNFTLVDTSKKG